LQAEIALAVVAAQLGLRRTGKKGQRQEQQPAGQETSFSHTVCPLICVTNPAKNTAF